MQGMKTDTASCGVKNRRSQQMIKIHQHGSQQYEIALQPPISIEDIRYGQWYNKM